jgi:hypothetical protein
MISIVGFGRPKFKGAGAGAGTGAKTSTASAPTKKKESPEITAAIELLKSKGYTVTK